MMDEKIGDALKAGARAISDGFMAALSFAMESTALAVKIVFGLLVIWGALRFVLAVTA